RSSLDRRSTPPQISTLSLPDALPISWRPVGRHAVGDNTPHRVADLDIRHATRGQRIQSAAQKRPWRARCKEIRTCGEAPAADERDRKSTRLNSSHEWISYAVFCLKKK